MRVGVQPAQRLLAALVRDAAHRQQRRGDDGAKDKRRAEVLRGGARVQEIEEALVDPAQEQQVEGDYGARGARDRRGDLEQRVPRLEQRDAAHQRAHEHGQAKTSV